MVSLPYFELYPSELHASHVLKIYITPYELAELIRKLPLSALRRTPPPPATSTTSLPPTVSRRGASGIKYGSPGQSLRNLRDSLSLDQPGQRQPTQHSDPVAVLEEELLSEEATATAEAILAAAARAQ